MAKERAQKAVDERREKKKTSASGGEKNEKREGKKQKKARSWLSHQGVVSAGAQRHHVVRLGGVLLCREASEVDLLLFCCSESRRKGVNGTKNKRREREREKEKRRFLTLLSSQT